MNAILEAGTRLDQQYEIVRLLGRGDFGIVYQARDQQVSADLHFVAVKQMPMQMIVNCERQANLRGALIHPAIPRILGYFHQDGFSYLVQEFICGSNLETVLDEQPGFLPEYLVHSWAIQLCDVLDYLHNHPYHPIIYRDIKPNNVMVDDVNQIHLVDFGLARAFPPGYFQERSEVFQHFREGLAIGTAGYSPPEQYQGLLEPQSDFYALGATLHHLLTRRDPRKERPFTFQEHPVRSINPDISREMESVVMRAVYPDVAARFSTVGEMERCLGRITT